MVAISLTIADERLDLLDFVRHDLIGIVTEKSLESLDEVRERDDQVRAQELRIERRDIPMSADRLLEQIEEEGLIDIRCERSKKS